MNAVLRNVFAVLGGALVGSVVNMGLIMVGSLVVAPPAGVDPMDAASIADHIDSFGPRHFLFPFLAHALGTLVGAALAARIASSRHRVMAMLVGALFLVGGIANAQMIPAPTWFLIADLVLAYLPMAWLGWKLARARS